MTPADLYRWTMKLRPEGIDNMPNINNLNEFINTIWRGSDKYAVDPSQWFFRSRHPFKNESYHNMDIGGEITSLLEIIKRRFRDC